MAARLPLQASFEAAARTRPGHPAVEELGGAALSYRELDDLANRTAARLRQLGVRRGDRVGICLPKTIDSLAALLATLKAGGAYVPVDPTAPAARSAFIFADCAVRVVVVDTDHRAALAQELERLDHFPTWVELGEPGGGAGLERALAESEPRAPAEASGAGLGDPTPEDPAYILYTSGSTGRPKGVVLSHENAVSFVEWVRETFHPTPEDRFSSHAPFHFDLSILDIYAPLGSGATLVLIGEEAGKEPLALAAAISEKQLTVWYSTPSILSLLAQYGKLERHDLSRLRLVLFAGEVFPVRHLRTLQERLPAPRYFNLYGPTETNVCNWFEVPVPIPAERTAPFPIGEVCAHLRGRIIDERGEPVPPGGEGELLISGPGVTRGYWNLPERNAVAFLRDPDGTAWYRTGDIVLSDPGGCMTFVGRRDRMVKRRGYRVELGEVEAGLYRHPGVQEAAVVALADEENGVRLKACIALREGQRGSVIEFKAFCRQELPAYMVPDVFQFLPALPHTSTDKIDYQRLKDLS